MDEPPDAINSKVTLHPFVLQVGHELTRYYAYRKEEQIGWVKAIKEVVGQANLSDFYQIEVCRTHENL